MKVSSKILKRIICYLVCISMLLGMGLCDVYASVELGTKKKVTTVTNYQIKIYKTFDSMIESLNINIYLDGKKLNNKMIIKKVSEEKATNNIPYNIYKISKIKYGTHTLKITGDYLQPVTKKFVISSKQNKKSYTYSLLYMDFTKSLRTAMINKSKSFVKTFYTGALTNKKYTDLKFSSIVKDTSCKSKYNIISSLYKNEVLPNIAQKTLAIKSIKIDEDSYYRRDGIFSDIYFTITYNDDYIDKMSEKEGKYDKLINGRIFCVYKNKRWYIEEFQLHFEDSAAYWQ